MSGTEYLIDDAFDLIGGIFDEISRIKKEHDDNKKIIKTNKDKISETFKVINISHEKEVNLIVNNADTDVKNHIEELSRDRKKQADRKVELDIELDNIIKELEELSKRIQHADIAEKDDIYKRLGDLERTKEKTEEELQGVKSELDSLEKEISRIINSINDINSAQIYPLTIELDRISKNIMDKIMKNINSDVYCEYSLTASRMVLESIMKEDITVEGFITKRDKLKMIELYVDENIERINNGYRSAAIIDAMEKKLRDSFRDYSITRNTNSNSPEITEIIIDFGIDKSIVKIEPDGNGKVKTVILNEIDDNGDEGVHNQRCGELSRAITEALNGNNYSSINPLSDEELREWENRKGRTSPEILRDSYTCLNDRINRI